jgi:DNA-binding MarR family transcriptional regulator
MKKFRPSDAIRRAHQHLSAAFPDSGVTLPQTAVLRALDAANCALTQKAIIAATGIDRSTLSELVRRMETTRLVTLAPNPEDRRSVLVTLTPKGRSELLHDASDNLSEAETSMLKMVSAKDRAAFVRGLQAIAEAV